jgi:transposase
MEQCNKEIRNKIHGHGLKQWEVAEKIGIGDATFCVWLRRELKGTRLERTEKAIDELLEEK